MKINLDWSKLKRNQCPKCGKDIAFAKRIETSNGPGIQHECGFTISDIKFSGIVVDRLSKDMMYEDAEVTEESFI